MTDRDIIIRLATEVMGWKIRAVALTSGIFDDDDGGTHIWPSRWNPLESWADVMELEGALSLDKREAYLAALDIPARAGATMWDQMWAHVHATPRQRCEAMIVTLDAARRQG